METSVKKSLNRIFFKLFRDEREEVHTKTRKCGFSVYGSRDGVV